MRGKAVVAVVSLAVGLFLGTFYGGVPGVTARASKTYVVRCMAEQFNLTNPNVTLHNPSSKPVKIKQLALSNSGLSVNVGSPEFTLPPKQSTTINYPQNQISVVKYTTKSKIFVDGFVFYEHPLDSHEDSLRHMGCFGD
ncbi:MAG: hypothetical protein WD826_00625 [Actinomycetota bacterium]